MMARNPNLQKRFKAALTVGDSDIVDPSKLIRSLRRRGVVFGASGPDHCTCFPRTVAPRMIDGELTCRLCALRIDSAREAKVSRELGR